MSYLVCFSSRTFAISFGIRIITFEGSVFYFFIFLFFIILLLIGVYGLLEFEGVSFEFSFQKFQNCFWNHITLNWWDCFLKLFILLLLIAVLCCILLLSGTNEMDGTNNLFYSVFFPQATQAK